MEFTLQEAIPHVLHQIDANRVMAEVLHLLYLIKHAHLHNKLCFLLANRGLQGLAGEVGRD